MRLALAFALALATASLPLSHARAEEGISEEEDAQARALFLAGKTYFDRGEYAQALEQFSRAYTLSKRAGLLLDAGLSAERAGFFRDAVRYYERYLAQEPDTTHEEELEQRLIGLRQRVARDEQAGLLKKLRESTPDAVTRRKTRSVPEDTGPVEAFAPAPTGTLITWSTAGAGLLTAGIFGTLALLERNKLDDCGPAGCSDDQYSSLRLYNRVTDASLIAAGVFTVAGAIWWLVDGNQERPPHLKLSHAGPSSVALTF